jgi:cytochrome b6-f complex iron-sulfur subunit
MTVEAGTAESSAAMDEMSRREFLNYAWLASLGILTLELGVVLYQFALPRLEAGEFGGPVDIGSPQKLPGVGADPEAFSRAKFWWVRSDEGALALYKVCTHLGCIFDWKPDQGKFICPCHGSQFEREGDFIGGPAPRGLDRFVIRAVDENGNEVARTNEDGDPLPIPEGTELIVETGLRILGPPRA